MLKNQFQLNVSDSDNDGGNSNWDYRDSADINLIRKPIRKVPKSKPQNTSKVPEMCPNFFQRQFLHPYNISQGNLLWDSPSRLIQPAGVNLDSSNFPSRPLFQFNIMDQMEEMQPISPEFNAETPLIFNHWVTLCPTDITEPNKNWIKELPSQICKDKQFEEGLCNVCLNPYKKKQKIRVMTCSHVFHQKCIDKWLKIKPSCPICRKNLSK